VTAEAFVTIRPEMSRFGGELKSGLAGAAKMAGTAMLGVGAAISGVAVAGLKEFATLERGMNEVFTLAPGMSAEAMGAMTDDVRSFAREMGTSTNEVVPALYQAISAGVPTDNVFDFLETANKAAIGGVTSLETAVDGISSVVNAYGGDVIDAAEASDLMFTAVRLGKTNFEELSASLFNVLPTASATNVAFEDITAAMASMTAAGVPTSVATTQMRQLLVELSKDGGKASDAFKEIAGVGFAEFMEQGNNVADALTVMDEAASKNGVAIQDMFGSVEAGNAALALGGDNLLGYMQNLDEMSDSAGATSAAHEQMDQGLSRAWERIKTNIQVALGEIGERLAPTFQAFADWVVDNMPAITDFVVGAFEAIAGFITNHVVPTFQALIGWWRDNGPAIVDTVRTVIDGITAAFEVVAAAVGTVIDWFRNLGSESEGTAGWLMDVWGQVQGVLVSAFEAITAIIERFIIWGTWIWENWGEGIMRLLSGVWEGVKGIISGALNVIQGIFEVFAGLFTGDWSRLWDGVKQIFSGLWDIIVGIFQGAVSIIVGIFEGLWSAVTGIASGIAEGVSNLFGSMRDRVTNTVSNLRDGVVERFESMRDRTSDLAGKLRDQVVSAYERLPGPVRDQLEKMWGFISGIFDRIRQFVSDVMSIIRNIITGNWSAAGDEASNLVQRMADFITGILGRLRDAIVGLVGRMASEFIAGISRLRQGAIDRFRSLLEWVRGLPARILSALGNVGRLLFDAGKQIIQGLTDGIKSVAKAPVDAVKSVGSSIVNGAKGLFGIESPSKVFMQIGEQTTEGLALGLAKDADRVSRQMLDMLDVPRVSAIPDTGTPTGGAQPGGHGPVTLQVYGSPDARTLFRARDLMETF
jgi:TP901 family phage tail tape measure protein